MWFSGVEVAASAPFIYTTLKLYCQVSVENTSRPLKAFLSNYAIIPVFYFDLMTYSGRAKYTCVIRSGIDHRSIKHRISKGLSLLFKNANTAALNIVEILYVRYVADGDEIYEKKSLSYLRWEYLDRHNR